MKKKQVGAVENRPYDFDFSPEERAVLGKRYGIIEKMIEDCADSAYESRTTGKRTYASTG